MKFPLVRRAQNLLRSPVLYQGNFITVDINTLSWQFLCPCRRLEVMAHASEFCLVRQRAVTALRYILVFIILTLIMASARATPGLLCK